MKKFFNWKRLKSAIACVLIFGIMTQTAPLYAFAAEEESATENIAYFPSDYYYGVDVMSGAEEESAEINVQETASEEIDLQSLTDATEIEQTAVTAESTQPSTEAVVRADPYLTDGSEELTHSQTDETDTAAGENSENSSEQTTEAAAEETAEQNQTANDVLYQDGKIKIYNAKQLAAVGTGAAVKTGDSEEETFGTGDDVLADGQAVTYGLNSSYQLMNDIPLSSESLWILPENFGGSFTASIDKTENPILYDEASDSIYIYSNYQLMIIASENAEKEPVMTGDTSTETFGIGQFIYPEGEEDGQKYITYSKDHNYILSPNFTEAMPELKANTLANEDAEGRDFAGQVIKEIDGKTYILIGNEDQLRAIGSGKNVYTAVYQAIKIGVKWQVDTDSEGNPIMLYGGDADLSAEQNGNKTYEFQKIDSASGALTGRCGVNQGTGEIDPNMYIDTSGKKYDSDENYIIFRDITLTENWTPLDFSGVMEGRKNMVEGSQPTISNININVSGKLDTKEHIGIGFFGTLSNTVNINRGIFETEITYGSKVVVKDICFEDMSVINSTTNVKDNFSLTELLFDLVGVLESDKTTFSTGAFAGRIVGNVEVTNCDIIDLKSLSNEKDVLGGFVGSVSGDTIYATDSLGVLIDVLATILNIIPFLGLGDLVEILLNGNGLVSVNLGELVPLAYNSPKITCCSVKYSNALQTIGKTSNNFNGSFAGRIEGAYLDDCEVLISENSSLTIAGKDFVGGFAGSVVNGQVQGALDRIADLISFNPHSVVTDCKVNENGTGSVYVSATGSYVGGFSGTLNSSYLIDIVVGGLAEVNGEKYVGGVTGYSTVGWASTLGENYGSINNGLLGTLGGILSGVVGGANPSKETSLLSLAGAFPSKIFGATVNGNNLTITARDSFAGGFVGHGDGLTIARSDDAHVNDLRPIKNNNVSYTGQNRANSLTGLASVVVSGTSGETPRYAGGIAGRLAVASGAGVLNSTLGLTSYINFEMSDITVTGSDNGYTVSSKEYAGGAFGEAIGGTIDNVTLNNISGVTAENYAGGFVGATGTGALASGGGLDLLGLGLIKIDNLLSVADAIETKINYSKVNGNNLTVSATGSGGELVTYHSGGFVAYSACATINNSSVTGLKKVSADNTSGVAGGFAGTSTTAGLAEVAGENGGGLEGILAIDGLLSAVTYMVPDYNLCSVSFVSNVGEGNTILPQVEADIAGGFAGDFQSGHINNQDELIIPEGYIAVENIEQVKGGHYAGGFVGKAYAGGLAEGGGLSLLGGLIQTNISNLLSVLNVYMPIIKNSAVEASSAGLKVEADRVQDSYAGGYIGFGSGVQISDSSVGELRHTVVAEPADLEAESISSYYDDSSDYAVIAGEYAGGYAGLLDIGNAANLVDSVKLLNLLTLDNLLGALDVTASKVNNSTVSGAAGGYSVLASTSDGSAGNAGGYAGAIYGSQVANSDANNFAYIIGRDSAGGYAGTIEPGDVLKVINTVNKDGKEEIDADVQKSLLEQVIQVENGLATLLETFVPFVENSNAISIPCGSAVRAEKSSDGSSACGTAGGFVGHSVGGQIDTCQAIRIRSVFGSEYAGGFTGWAEGANVADTGSLSILFGVVKLNNPLQVAEAVYPTEKNTRVSGPMTDLDFNTWDSWAKAVGVSGAYGSYFHEYSQKGDTERESIYEERKNNYACGFNVEAGRHENISSQRNMGGDAGGYVGRIDGAYIENAVVDSVANVRAYRTAGGFVGNMRAGNVANAGEIDLAGINILDNLSLIEAFVPVVKGAQVNGFVSGLSVEAYGITAENGPTVGRAGGFAGYIVGGQISGIEDEGVITTKTTITKLRKVNGTSDVGGFAGSIESGSALDLNINESGLLNQILKYIIDSEALASVLNATVPTIKDVEISSWDSWGITVNGFYTEEGSSDNKYYAESAGGFAGKVSGAIIGTQKSVIADSGLFDDNTSDDEEYYIKKGVRGVTIDGLREVCGGKYAGGFVGLADVGSLIDLSKDDTTSILSIIKLGNTSVANMFRTYIYDSHIIGSANYGLKVTANTSGKYGTMEASVYAGNAGGFAGSFMNSTVEDSDVTGLRSVSALNCSGGFIGYSGKSGLVDLDQASVVDDGYNFSLLNGAVGVVDLFGSTVNRCDVSGIESGSMISSAGGTEEKAGGFIGFGDLARISQANVNNLKQVTSSKVAGGFIGETSFEYLVDLELSSALTEALVIPLLQAVLDALNAGDLTKLDLVNINLGILKIGLLYDGNLISVDLLGLKISIQVLADKNSNDGVLSVNIGDSYIRVNYTDGKIDKETSDIEASLIKGNRTRVADSSVTGISYGYDVYAGGSGNNTDASSSLEKTKGSSGGFVGYNNEGLLENNDMYFCDVVKGKDGEVGPFVGLTSLDTSYDFNTIEKIEGNDNIYRVYRHTDGSYPILKDISNKNLQSEHSYNEADYWNNVYTINHITSVEKFKDFENAKIAMEDNSSEIDAGVYASGAKAVLMGDIPSNPGHEPDDTEPPEIQDPCEDEFVRITIHGTWDDWFDRDGIRPEELKIRVIGEIKGENGEIISEHTITEEISLTGLLSDSVWTYKSGTGKELSTEEPTEESSEENTESSTEESSEETSEPDTDESTESTTESDDDILLPKIFKAYVVNDENERMYYDYRIEYVTPEEYSYVEEDLPEGDEAIQVVETTADGNRYGYVKRDYYNFYLTLYHSPDLPVTGGSGTSVFNMVGILFLGGFAFMTYLKYGKKRKDAENRKNK